jgi:hypothetical protein
VVIEYRVQTAGGRGERPPGQTAGLVADRTAKARARRDDPVLLHRPSRCAGTMYFGFNITKTEGDPPTRADWSLTSPA